ncbi:MAG: YHS domain-containing protein [bacterium]
MDPVCGMEVNVEEAEFSTDHKGQKIYFCSEVCKEEFESEPEQYISDLD